ncbi:DUF835 domain-containing protein [Thermococcus argininiproducens]|uniref:DUF835 domain-containing protein n=1 Tax=Thermococcus argininiproducens TaxID=2866384 RepID=A0A9E7MC44_9EURY|nr:DUF835 domain-containing protein [Thermococcus argininiproducens]USH00548.1 DUF835 domain-containing protein [Thermococcus argininiproducens]
MTINLYGLITGLVIMQIGIFGVFKAYKYYRSLKEPRKILAKILLISFILFTLGSIGVIIDSISQKHLWEIGAISFTASYLYLATSLLRYLYITMEERKETKRTVEKRSKLPISGAYIIRKPLSPERIEFFFRYSSGLLVISRTQKPLWVKKYGLEPDKFLWISRMEGKDKADPLKLHVIQDEILKFIRRRKGGCVIYFEGIEYLMLYNEFTSVAKFFFSLKDYAISGDSLLILYLPPKILETSQEATILKEFKVREEKELVREISQKLLANMLEGEDKNASNKSKEK